MSALTRWVSVRHLLHEWPRTLLTLAGVALGVAMFVSIRLASHSAMHSFADTVDAVAGRANLEVRAGGEGLDERLYERVRRTPGVIAAAPLVELEVRAAGRRPDPMSAAAEADPGDAAGYPEVLRLLGIDVFAEPPFARYGRGGGGGTGAAHGARGASTATAETGPTGVAAGNPVAFLTDPRGVAITRTLAGRLKLALGDTMVVLASGVPTPLTVRWIVESPEFNQAFGGSVALLDIATAQELFHRLGRLDRIQLIVSDAARDRVADALRAEVPAGTEVGPPQGRTRQVESMVRAFRLNLTALSFIALLVSAFLVFNAISMAVLHRRREVGMLRALGVTRAGVLRLFVGEGLVLGVVGSVAGLALGTFLSRFTLLAVSRTLADLYHLSGTRHAVPDPVTGVVGVALGVGVALLASWAPALEAAATPPGQTLRLGMTIESRRVPITALAIAGVLVLVAGALVGAWTVHEQRPVGGFVSAFLLLAGFSLLTPGATLAIEALAAPLLRALLGVEGMLAARDVRESVASTSVVIASLMVAVGMTVALTIMVGSFRRTVDVWIGQSVRGDLYVEPVGHRQSANATALPPELIASVAQIPGVAAVDTYRASRIVVDGRLAFAVGLDFEVQRDRGGLTFLRGTARPILDRALREGGVIVSESFAHHHGTRAGDTLALATPGGLARVPVEGVFYDYSTDAGAVLMDRRLYAWLWNDARVESFALYLAPGASADAVRDSLNARVGGRIALHVMPNGTLRRRVLTVFDQTFQITWVLQFIAVLVSVLGVVAALTTRILHRGRDIGVLRASGARRAQVHRMVLAESALLGLTGAVLGCVAGVALALVLVHVINRQFFGWTLQLAIDPRVFLQAIVLMVGTSVLAGIAPARLAATRVASEAMRVE